MSTSHSTPSGDAIANAAAAAAAAVAATTPRYASPSAATDVGEFLSDLSAGTLEQMLSIALSKTAAKVVDHKPKKGKVTISFEMEGIDGTQQVRVATTLRFEHPTALGKAGEETTGADVMHVGRGGALSLAQPSLLDNKQTALNLG